MNDRITETTGGKVVAAGGYGCVFNPALKCVNNDDRKPKYVSKLMLKKYALSEYDDITKFKNDLEIIPNYKDYFLVDGFNICSPDKLTKDDLEDYSKKCRTLKKDGITIENINSKLDNLISLNMPNGGLDFGNYLEKHQTYNDLIMSNNSLINLLLKGILPMNKLGIYHCDIKESNILIDVEKDKMFARLIDWGLSVKIDKRPVDWIPDAMTNRPFQYNLPFSCILFNDVFQNMYAEFLSKNPNPEYYMIRTFIIDYIFVWNENRGPGHIKVIDNIFGKLFSMDLKSIPIDDKKLIIEMEYTYNYIVEYLSAILLKYTKNGVFYMAKYFNNVYLQIVDVWGLIISYEPILTLLFSKYQNLSQIELEIFNSLKHIFLVYLFEPRTEKISIQHLTSDLKKLNKLFEKSAGKEINLSSIKKQKPISFSKKSKTKKINKKNRSSKKTRKSSKETINLSVSERENIKESVKTYLGNKEKKEQERTASPSEKVEIAF